MRDLMYTRNWPPELAMRWVIAATGLVLSGPTLAQFEDKPPPDWMVRGFEAAVADRSSVAGAVANDSFRALARFVSPGERAGAVIDKLIPLLGDQDGDVRNSAAEAPRSNTRRRPRGRGDRQAHAPP